MSFSRRGDATEIMELRKQRLEQIRSPMDNAAIEIAKSLYEAAPVESGLLRQKLLVKRAGVEDADYSIGVAPISELGDPETSVKGRGFIAQFIKDYPEYSGHRPSNKKMAWWALSPKGKRVIDTLRDAGMYGGVANTPIYWGAIVQGKVPGVPQNNFVFKAMSTNRARIRRIIKDWLHGR